MSSNDIVFDPGSRQVLPISAAVSTAALPRFRQRDHARSALVREILDQFAHEAARRYAAVPAPADDQFCESICMEGSQISRAWRKTGAYEVRQVSTVPQTVDDTPPPLAFETVDDASLQTAAAVALAQLNDRKPSARRSHRLPRPALKAPRTASPVWLAAVIVLGALTAAVLLSRVLL
jgi:hypothetical protein